MELYLLAGVASAPHFLRRIREELHGRLAADGRHVHSEEMFPYGDWSRSLMAQLWEVRHDMRLGSARIARSIGGRYALQRVQPEGRGPLLFVGHSGGGVAAVHAAELLRREGRACAAVMIGSPRCRVPTELQSSVLSINAEGRRIRGTNGGGYSKDKISWIGSFGGWSLERPLLPRWRKDKHAPGHFRQVSIRGGHADYFRESEPFRHAQSGRSNLEETMDLVLDWLRSSGKLELR